MKSPSIGRCIYCGRSDLPLRREHIVPYGLNGNWVLRDASCPNCARITGQVERDVLRNILSGPRSALSMRTRRPKQRQKLYPLQVISAGKRQVIMIPLEDYPVILSLPIFAPPAHISSTSFETGINLRKFTYLQLSGPSFPELKEKYSESFDFVGSRIEYQPILFARMLAKIGFGMTVMSFGLDAISKNYVLDSILCRSGDVGRWVGSVEVPPICPTHGLHAVGIYVTNGEFHAKIRLFAQFHQQEYLVIVGTVRDEAIQQGVLINSPI